MSIRDKIVRHNSVYIEPREIQCPEHKTAMRFDTTASKFRCTTKGCKKVARVVDENDTANNAGQPIMPDRKLPTHTVQTATGQTANLMDWESQHPITIGGRLAHLAGIIKNQTITPPKYPEQIVDMSVFTESVSVEHGAQVVKVILEIPFGILNQDDVP